jgi:hypothetical protein
MAAMMRTPLAIIVADRGERQFRVDSGRSRQVPIVRF